MLFFSLLFSFSDFLLLLFFTVVDLPLAARPGVDGLLLTPLLLQFSPLLICHWLPVQGLRSPSHQYALFLTPLLFSLLSSSPILTVVDLPLAARPGVDGLDQVEVVAGLDAQPR